MNAISFDVSSCDCQLDGKFPPYYLNGYWSRRRKRQEIRKEAARMQCCDDGKGCRSTLVERGWGTYMIESCQYSSATEARERTLKQGRKRQVMTTTRVMRLLFAGKTA
jgi:hypothetical protein